MYNCDTCECGENYGGLSPLRCVECESVKVSDIPSGWIPTGCFLVVDEMPYEVRPG